MSLPTECQKEKSSGLMREAAEHLGKHDAGRVAYLAKMMVPKKPYGPHWPEAF